MIDAVTRDVLDPEEAEEAKYDVLEVTNSESMFHDPCKKALELFNQGASGADKIDVDQTMKSKGVLAIDTDVYLTNKSEKAVMCVLNGILVLIYKKS